MKKLFLSAFAMSLCFLLSNGYAQTEGIDDFLGLETEILPDLKGKQRFSPRDLHQKTEWNVEEKQVEIDSEPLKGQGYSLIPWDTQDPQEWLSVDRWLLEREIKDRTPDWKIRLRDDRQLEHVGKVLQCRGKCEVFRGTMKSSVQHLSRINEGDELKTEADSVAWIYLMDGTLVRVGPSSSVSFQEINWSKSEVFQLVRLHQGHIYWHPRDTKDYPLELNPETDSYSLPLLVRESNQAFFERNLFQKQSDFARSEEAMKLEETAVINQIAALNNLKAANNKTPPPVTKVMLVAPNATLVGKLTSFDFFHYPGGKAHFKKRNSQEGFDLTLHLRGHNNTSTSSVSDDAWFEIDVTGRESNKVEVVSGQLEITELLTRRIKTIELAREHWMEKYTQEIVKNLENPKELAIKNGYTLWGEDLSKRFNFLVEYTRRMETTNLKSMDNLLKKVEGNGEFAQKEMSDSHYKATLNYYLRDLKTRYTNRRMQVREMNDLQYYIWILRNGKPKT